MAVITSNRLETKEEVFAAVLDRHRQAQSALPPSQSIKALWPTLRKQIPQTLMEQLAQERVAQQLSKDLTNARHYTADMESQPRTIPFEITTYPALPDAPSHKEIMHIPVQHIPWQEPEIIKIQVLYDTSFFVNGVSKMLIHFTREDFQYCIEKYVDQRNGIDRHISAMHEGLQLLAKHEAETLDSLPPEVQHAFAATWKAALNNR